jgi:hypothetical protein
MQMRRAQLPKDSDGQGLALPDLQTRYAGYFSAYLARKIAVLDNQC